MKNKFDPDPIPAWALSSESFYPCPCGRPTLDGFVATKGPNGFVRLFHQGCFKHYLELKEIDGVEEDD